MKLYGGIHLHPNNSVVALCDGGDRVAYRRRLSNDAELILTALAPFREVLVGLVVESNYNSSNSGDTIRKSRILRETAFHSTSDIHVGSVIGWNWPGPPAELPRLHVR